MTMNQTPDQIVAAAIERGITTNPTSSVAAAVRALAQRKPADAARLVAAARTPLDVAAIVLAAEGGATVEGVIATTMKMGRTREQAEAMLINACGAGESFAAGAFTPTQLGAVDRHIRASTSPSAFGAQPSLEGVRAQLIAMGMTPEAADARLHRQVVVELEDAIRSRG
jgi:hypothetical protein